MKYPDFSDAELLKLAQEKDSEAVCEIIERYKNLIKHVIRSYYLVGGDYEDLLQEGYFGLHKAIMTYNGKSNFKSYAYVCIKNGIISAVEKDNSKKNFPLNTSVSLSKEDEVNKNDIPDNNFNPEENYLGEESERELIENIRDVLSVLESKILDFYLEGYTYSEIGDKLGKNEKAIDNAIQRIRKKVALKILK